MSTTIKYTYDGSFLATLEYDNGGWAELGLAHLAAFWRLFWDLHAVTPVAALLVKRSLTNPQVVSYKLTTADNRVWDETMAFDNPDNPTSAFDIPGGWRATEYTVHRPLRAEVQRLHKQYGFQKIDITVTGA